MSAAVLLIALLAVLPATALAAIDGRVVNRTNGEPAGGILITLLKFEAGMDPIEEVRTDANGAFRFERELVGANGSAVPGMLRAEFEGVSYSEMIPPGAPSNNVEVAVFSVDERQTLAPRMHILIFEPGAGEMVVNENFAFLNETNPPRTFRDAANGTLRFYLPPEAKGIVQVRAAGPQRMPLRSVATPAGEPNIYKVDFPLKPGDNSIDLTYLLPYTDGAEFQGRLLYEGVDTRVAVPQGVTLDGEGLASLGPEPRTQASIYDLSAAATFNIRISGQGQLARSGGPAAAASGGGSEIRITDAPVSKELYWVLGLTTAVLIVGFVYLYSKQPGSDEPKPVVTKTPATVKPSRAASRARNRPATQPES